MKLDARDLRKILAEFGLNPAEVLYIGDRDDRDGINFSRVWIKTCRSALYRRPRRSRRHLRQSGGRRLS